MFALALKARVPDAEISGVELPEWGISTPAAPAQTGARVRVVKHDVPFAKVARRLSSADTIDVDLYRLNLRFEYYRDQLELFRRTFPRREIEGAGRDEIAISIRGGEILTGQHQNFLPLPISLYERIVDSTGLRPVFAGQIGDDPYSSALRARFPNARFVKHQSGLADFHFLRASHNIVVAISSYSWLASWLSEIRRADPPAGCRALPSSSATGLQPAAARRQSLCLPSNGPALLVRPARGTLPAECCPAFGLRLSAGHRFTRVARHAGRAEAISAKSGPPPSPVSAGSGGRPAR